jgi:hypothetical protein
MKMRHVGN